MRIEFTVPGVPIAQPRAKATTINGRARMYTPDASVRPFKEAIRILYAEAFQGPPAEGPVTVKILAVFPRPKNMIWKTKPMPRVPHAVRPDFDNVAKSVLDALHKQAWRDDAQVAHAIVKKVIASGSEQPHTVIVIEAD